MSGSKIRLYGSTSGYVELEAPAVSPDGVLTLPALAGGFGKVGQIVQGTLTATFVTSSTSYVDITGLSATITPSSTTSKVLLIAQIAVGGASTQTGNYRFTGGNSDTYVGAASGNKTQAVFGGIETMSASAVGGLMMMYVDSPATTSAVTYKAQVMVGSASAGTVRINLSSTDTSNDTNDRVRGASSLVAIEVAA